MPGVNFPASVTRYSSRVTALCCNQSIQRSLEFVGMRTFRLRQRFKPVGDLVKTFFARCLGHAWIHVGVLVGLAGNSRFQILLRRADRQIGGGVAHVSQIIQVTVRVTGFALCRIAE